MGPLLCLLSAAGFGAMAIFGKLAYDADVGVGDLLLVRFALAARGPVRGRRRARSACAGCRAARSSPGWRWARSATRRSPGSTSSRSSGWTPRCSRWSSTSTPPRAGRRGRPGTRARDAAADRRAGRRAGGDRARARRRRGGALDPLGVVMGLGGGAHLHGLHPRRRPPRGCRRSRSPRSSARGDADVPPGLDPARRAGARVRRRGLARDRRDRARQHGRRDPRVLRRARARRAARGLDPLDARARGHGGLAAAAFGESSAPSSWWAARSCSSAVVVMQWPARACGWRRELRLRIDGARSGGGAALRPVRIPHTPQRNARRHARGAAAPRSRCRVSPAGGSSDVSATATGAPSRPPRPPRRAAARRPRRCSARTRRGPRRAGSRPRKRSSS